jgi:hypothetical protein
MPALHEGTLADLRTLMGHPPRFRRGYSSVDVQPNPAAGANFSLLCDAQYWRRINACYFTFTPSATGTPREIFINYLDGSGNIFNQVPVASLVTASKVTNCSGDLTANVGEPPLGSQQNYGTQTSPAAGTTIATVGAVEPGNYTVYWTVELQGTTAAGTDNDNFGLYANTSLVLQSVNSEAVGTYPQIPFELELSGAASVSVKNINAATTGAVYSAEFMLEGSGPNYPRFRLPDIILQPGWTWQINIYNPAGTDQLSNINLLVEHYASDWASGTADLEREAMLDALAERLWAQ